GIDEFLKTELPWLLSKNAVVMANISGNTVDEYCQMVEKLDKTGITFIEVNVSCPNVHCGGKVFAATPEGVYEVTKAVRAMTHRPVLIKLSPNVADITEVALAAQQGGADGISLINTLTGMAIDVKTRKPILANVTGGLSGPAVRPVALRMCYQAAQAVKIPVVGMGGIMSGEDAVMFLLAGCTAVQVGTANLVDPMACIRILEELEQYMIDNGITKVTDLIGALITE
ncbi:MAG: dihydroorotate dehydrogenase, partial [Oscillospiraceae bacterium]|nr:dihydroorotate dehydrogenase [Oscillospiraceae bacterium]